MGYWCDRVTYTARGAPSTDQLYYVYALVIHWNRNQVSPGRHESLARAGIARLFHTHEIFGIQQNLCGNLLRDYCRKRAWVLKKSLRLAG